ncbi:MAG: gliding motility-associated C-terminal domain-containing protein [Bacteroidota bacterium]
MRTYRYCLAGFIYLFIWQPLQAQLETAWWYLDGGRHLDFRTDPPTYDDTPKDSSGFVYSTSMCDAQGNLRFYGDVVRAADTAFMRMPGSIPHLTPLNTSRVSGQVLAVETDSTDQYLYLLGDAMFNDTVHRWQVRSAVVDMTLRGGLGDVRPPVQIVMETPEFSVFAGVYSCEADQFWLVVASSEYEDGLDGTTFSAFRLEGTTFSPTPVVTDLPGVQVFFSGSDMGSRFRFSPDARKIAFPQLDPGPPNAINQIGIVDFDPFTGEVANPILVDSASQFTGSLEFSPNSELLYATGENTLFQYDLTQSSSIQTVLATELVGGMGSIFLGASLQLGLDGRLYVSTIGRMGLDVVQQPNLAGASAQFQRDFIPFNHEIGITYLPYFSPHYFHQPVIPGELQADTSICPFDTIQLRNTLLSDSGYVWEPAQYVDDPLAAEPRFVYPQFAYADTTIVMTVRILDGLCTVGKRVAITIKGQPAPPFILGSMVVCPFVDSVEYWVTDDTLGSSFQWLVSGGEILSGQGTDRVQINWFDTNNQAEVRVIRTGLACRPDTSHLKVRIQFQLEPSLPTGPDLSCWEPGTILTYETFPATQGSIYTWGTTNGTPVSGQGSPIANFSWTESGLQQIWVQEQSTTIDTVCTGVSDTFLVDLYIDSSRVELGYVSMNPDIPGRIEGAGFADFHPLVLDSELRLEQSVDGDLPESILFEQADSLRFERGIAASGSLSYRYRLTGLNSCGDMLRSNWHQLIQLRGTDNDGAGPIELTWTAYAGWPVQRYEVWRQTERSAWALLDTLPPGQLSYTVEDLKAGLEHRYQVRGVQANGPYHSWSNPIEFFYAHPIRIPNVFTPNGDGIHDTFVIENLELYPDHQLDIFDRWGRKVFTASPYQNDWGAEGVKAGTYYYRLRVKETGVQKGGVAVLR